MKSKFSLLALTLFCSLNTTLSLQAAPAELISNSTFSSGLEGWQPQKLESTEASFEIKDIEGGKHALCITVPQPGAKRYFVQLLHPLDVQLSSGKSYTLSFRVRSKPGASIVVILRGQNAPKGEIWREDPIALTEEWKTYSYTFTPPQDGAATTLLISGLASVAGEYWFTHVSLQEGTGTPIPTP